MKKVLFVAGLVALLAVGCGKKEEVQTSQNPTTPEQTTTVETPTPSDPGGTEVAQPSTQPADPSTEVLTVESLANAVNEISELSSKPILKGNEARSETITTGGSLRDLRLYFVAGTAVSEEWATLESGYYSPAPDIDGFILDSDAAEISGKLNSVTVTPFKTKERTGNVPKYVPLVIKDYDGVVGKFVRYLVDKNVLPNAEGLDTAVVELLESGGGSKELANGFSVSVTSNSYFAIKVTQN
jgi:hypothetical protein